MKKLYTLFFSFSIMVTLLNAQPALPIYESFGVNLGTLAGQNNWTGNQGVGLGAQAVDSNLTYTGLYNAPNTYGVRVGNQPSGSIQQLFFASQTTKTYVSYLIRLSVMPIALASQTNTSTYVAIGLDGTSAGCMYAFPNTDGTSFELGFSSGANVTTANNNKTNRQFQLGETILVVMAFTPSATGTGGTGSLNVWVNPLAASLASGATEPTPNFLNRLGSNSISVNNVHLRSGAGTRSMIFDELRVGSSWGDVTTTTVALPVSLKDFKLNTNNNTSALSWTSESEINFDKYIVLFTNNGLDYKEVGTVEGRGNNSTYSFNYIHRGSGFFKLKLVDLDGRFVYSNVLHAKTKSISIQVSPNPVVDKLYITGMPEGKNTAVVYTLSGASIRTQTINDTNITLSIGSLPAGQYVVKVINNNNLIYSTIIAK